LKCDGTCAETRFRLSGETGRVHLNRCGGGRQFSRLLRSRGVRISGSNAGYTMFRCSVKGTGYPNSFFSFPLHFSSRASPCAITFQLESATGTTGQLKCDGTRAETRIRLSGETGRVHLNRHGGGVSAVDYYAAEVCASAVVMLYTPCSVVV